MSAAAMAMALTGVCGIGGGSAHADSFEVNVSSFCGFRSTAGENGAVADSITYTGAGVAGAEVKLDNNGKHKFNVYCNYEYGYNITASATDLVDSSANKTIGYTTDYKGNEESGAWTAKLTNANENAVIPGGASAEPALIKSRSDITAETGDDFEVEYKIYIGGRTTPGTYTGTATYTVAQNPVPALTNDMAMQNAPAARCAATPYYDGSTEEKAAETTITMKDTRDNKKYLVRRLADGNCWMVQNLALAGGTHITNENSDLLATNTAGYTLPESNRGPAGTWTTDEEAEYYNENWEYMWNGTHKDGQADTPPTAHNNESAVNLGAFYSYQTAIANSLDKSVTGDAPESICPKGWKLPTSGNDGAQWNVLMSKYTSATFKSSFNVAMSGYCYSSNCPYKFNGAFYQSSRSGYSLRATSSNTTSSVSLLSTFARNQGLSVRCVLVAAQ